jgi:hypothetical protein
VSITVGQKPRSREQIEPFIRRDIASMKTAPGTTTGIQIYDLKLEGTSAVVLCLVGGTRTEIIDDALITWGGLQVRDTWIRTPTGWKRRMHEKLTVNEPMLDGRPVKQ